MKYRIYQKNGKFYPQYKKWIFWKYYLDKFAGYNWNIYFDTFLEASNFLYKNQETIHKIKTIDDLR